MGDLCDQADIGRFLRSPEGQKELAEISTLMVGKAVTKVHFSNQVNCVGIGIQLDDGEVFECWRSELHVDALREQFEEVLKREFYKDYPERRSSPAP